MIISHKHKFIFIKTRKTAGTSIEIFLSKYCGEFDIISPTSEHIDGHIPRNYTGFWNPLPEVIKNQRRIDKQRRTKMVFRKRAKRIIKQLLLKKNYYSHIPAIEVRRRLTKDVWNNYYKFCVERNPFDKTLSHYHWINHRAGGNRTFEEYINRASFCTDYDNYTDQNGIILVDKIIKYESLAEELGWLFNKFDIPFDGTLGVSAKSDFRKDRRPYQEVYTDKQKAVIEKAFEKEIKLFGYKY